MQHFGHTSFVTGEKVFAFTRNNGVALKLPRPRAQALVETGEGVPLVMGKRVMTEWSVIRRKYPNEYKKDQRLFEEAISFVAAQAEPATRKKKQPHSTR